MDKKSTRQPPWFIFLLCLGLLMLASLACQISAPTPPQERSSTAEQQAETIVALVTQQAQMRANIEDLGVSATRQSADISTLTALATTQAADSCCDQVDRSEELISYLATRVGALASNGGSPTPYPTPTPYRPVTGSVLLEEGRCCAGGIAGDTITVTAVFDAESPVALVTDMRVRTGAIAFDEATMEDIAWEPYVVKKDLPVSIALNWTAFYVNVQFRDADGNLSPVVYDDISIEGEPAPPTPTP